MKDVKDFVTIDNNCNNRCQLRIAALKPFSNGVFSLWIVKL